MAWSGEILQTWQQGPLYKSLVSLNDGTANYVERFTYSGSSLALRRVVRSWIDAIESRSTVALAWCTQAMVDTIPTSTRIYAKIMDVFNNPADALTIVLEDFKFWVPA